VNRSMTISEADQILEIVTPRTNSALLSAAEHLFSALTVMSARGEQRPVALEIAADAASRRFLARCTDPVEVPRLVALVGAAYPQAEVRHFDPAISAAGDPAAVGPDEQCFVCTLELRRAPYLPLRTFEDRDLDFSFGSAQADPLLGVLGALGGLPPHWRAIVQLLVIAPAKPDWARAYQRLALEHPLERERLQQAGPSFATPLLLLGLLGLYAIGSSVSSAWARGDYLGAIGFAVAVLAAVACSVVVVRKLRHRELVDPRLVQLKLSRQACEVELRLAVIAPDCVAETAVVAQLARMSAAYRSFSLATGNALQPRDAVDGDVDLRELVPLGRTSLLNVRELAGLWHLPRAGDESMLVERTTARRRLPLPLTVAAHGGSQSACRIGVSAHQGQNVQVHLSDGLLRRHHLAVAKTRRGKSSLLLRLAHHLMQIGTRNSGDVPRSLVLVDPHRDLAVAALALVPRERLSDVVYLDVSNRRRPFGINLLDVGLGWDRDQATANALRIFKREFDGFWGPRMEDAFRFAVLALFEANQALCAEDPRHGRGAQHTILDVPAMLARRGFRQQVLKRTQDPALRQWFDGYFADLESRQRLEIINPVQTKVHKYLGSLVARQIVGQPRSTVDFRQLIAKHKIVLINLNAFDVGEDVAALVGGTLLNLAARAVSAQSLLAPADRQPVTLIVDEFHTLPGADYEQVFGELAKYGANMLLATQTLSRLDRLTDAQRTRDLRAAVFSNLDGLFAFHTSAEDAEYLEPELGGGLDAQDVLELGHYQCYARITDARTGERLPAFSVQLEAPPMGDPNQAAGLARASAEKYGRDAIDVELDLQSALDRIKGPQRENETDESDSGAGVAETGTPVSDGVVAGVEVPADGEQPPVQGEVARHNGENDGGQEPLEPWREPG
jgi:hypothetical protein